MLYNAFGLAILCLVIGAVLVLYRAVVGPGVFNRIMAMNFFGTKTVIILVLVGYVYGRPELFLDIALVYALINFTGVLAFLKYAKTGRLDK